ncbi:3-hydroxyacyl-CoA dehydrogenase [Salinactinospora qingdaonensis]|uniref:3-hydroxybutyryl-CoA dehydrogenase n=1 Tax=Salinactinospora qingdaonensis TaxID=702744 RepID=A0ABP7FRZ9_9ACTN
MVQEFHKVGVVGLGTMGAGIVEVFSAGGFEVTGVEIDEAALGRGRAHLEKSLAKAVSKGKLTEDEQRAILGRVTFTTSRDHLSDADFVVEAVSEDIAVKREVFTDLDHICPPGTVLATNTSSLSVTEIAAMTQRPTKVVGLHFFNPAPVMNLVEVAGTVISEEWAVEIATEIAKRVGKTPVVVSDRAGFVANALLVPYLNHAVSVYERGIASREEIDSAVVKSAGMPMGPLALLDLIGIDVALAVIDVLWAEFRGPRHAVAPLLRRMATAGLLGRKSGRGFYDYSRDEPPEEQPTGPIARRVRAKEAGFDLADLLLLPHLDDAVRMVGDTYATAEQVDTAIKLGCGYPKGPIELLNARGIESVVTGLRAMIDMGLVPADSPAPLLNWLRHEGHDTLRDVD